MNDGFPLKPSSKEGNRVITRSMQVNKVSDLAANKISSYQNMANQNMKLIEKFSHKITQEARKDIVLSQMANPKVSQI